MLTTILSGLIGLLSSGLPTAISIYRDSSDRRHELAILTLQMKYMSQGHHERLDEIVAGEVESLHRSAKSTGIKWIDGLRASVRPILTYLMFLMFMAYLFVGLYSLMIVNGESFIVAYQLVWGAELYSLFTLVITFWFGGRAWDKMLVNRR